MFPGRTGLLGRFNTKCLLKRNFFLKGRTVECLFYSGVCCNIGVRNAPVLPLKLMFVYTDLHKFNLLNLYNKSNARFLLLDDGTSYKSFRSKKETNVCPT